MALFISYMMDRFISLIRVLLTKHSVLKKLTLNDLKAKSSDIKVLGLTERTITG